MTTDVDTIAQAAARRCMDRAERDGAMHLDAMAEEIGDELRRARGAGVRVGFDPELEAIRSAVVSIDAEGIIESFSAAPSDVRAISADAFKWTDEKAAALAERIKRGF